MYNKNYEAVMTDKGYIILDRDREGLHFVITNTEFQRFASGRITRPGETMENAIAELSRTHGLTVYKQVDFFDAVAEYSNQLPY